MTPHINPLLYGNDTSATTLPAWLEAHVRALPCRHGLFHHFDFDVPVGASLAQYGEWAQAELDALSPYVPCGGNVLDVGANAGTHAVAFARMVGAGGSVTALEPQEEMFELLRRTVDANGLSDVIVPVRAGAGIRTAMAQVPRVAGQGRQNLGMVRLHCIDDADRDDTTGVADSAGVTHETDGFSTAHVAVLRLDDLCALHSSLNGATPAPFPGFGASDEASALVDFIAGIPNHKAVSFDLIKIDAEGAEADILRGGQSLICRCRPVLHLECNDFAHAWPAARLALQWGYAVFHVRHPAFNPANYRGARHNIFGPAEEAALLCIPRLRLESGNLPAPCGAEIRTAVDLAHALLATRVYAQPKADLPAERLERALTLVALARASELLAAQALPASSATPLPDAPHPRRHDIWNLLCRAPGYLAPAVLAAAQPDALHVEAQPCCTPSGDTPQAESFARLRAALPPARHDAARPVLMVTHNWGGGVERHVRDLCHRLAAEGTPALVLRPFGNHDASVWTLHLPQPPSLPRAQQPPTLPPPRFALPDDFGALAEALADLGVAHVHVHNLAGYPHAAPDLLALLARLLGAPLDVSVHDLAPLCPRITCIGPDGLPCATALAADASQDTAQTAPWRCTACLSTARPLLGGTDIVRWRAAWQRLLHDARRIFTPSADTARRIMAHFPDCAGAVAVRPYPEAQDHVRALAAIRQPCGATRTPGHTPGTPLRVAVIGAIGPHKGAAVLERCARHARKAGLSLHFTVLGYTDRDDTLRGLGVTITGAYAQDELPRLLAPGEGGGHHIALLPAIWPETYSFTLSEAVLAGLYPVTFDLGAPAERMRAWGYGLCLPTGHITNPAAINAALLACTPEAPPERVTACAAGAGRYPAPFRGSFYGLPVDGAKP